nr:hypothetical protein CFP56_10241 [Quercus suber]
MEAKHYASACMRAGEQLQVGLAGDVLWYSVKVIQALVQVLASAPSAVVVVVADYSCYLSLSRKMIHHEGVSARRWTALSSYNFRP